MCLPAGYTNWVSKHISLQHSEYKLIQDFNMAATADSKLANSWIDQLWANVSRRWASSSQCNKVTFPWDLSLKCASFTELDLHQPAGYRRTRARWIHQTDERCRQIRSPGENKRAQHITIKRQKKERKTKQFDSISLLTDEEHLGWRWRRGINDSFLAAEGELTSCWLTRSFLWATLGRRAPSFN